MLFGANMRGCMRVRGVVWAPYCYFGEVYSECTVQRGVILAFVERATSLKHGHVAR